MAYADLPLIQASDFSLLGSFTLNDPNSYFQFGGWGFGHDPAGNGGTGSLWMSGITGGLEKKIGEIAIPALGGQANVLTVPSIPPNIGSNDSVGGSLIYNDKLCVSMFVFYDVSNTVGVVSHYYGSDKTVANLGQPRKLGSLNPGFYAGYMGHIPAEYQSLFGGPCVTGQCGISGINRTSFGPGLFVFNPEDLGSTEAPAIPLVYYPDDHVLGPGLGTTNLLYNYLGQMSGAFFPVGSRSVCFVGRIGAGNVCYGTAQDTNPLQDCELIDPITDHRETYDPVNSDQGYHGWPYRHQVWAYDGLDMLDVKNGIKQPWEIEPYAVWELPGMATGGDAAAAFGSATYDLATRKLYFGRGAAFDNTLGTNPTIFVWQTADLSGEPPPDGDSGGPIVAPILSFL